MPDPITVNVDTSDATAKISTLSSRMSTLVAQVQSVPFWRGVFSDQGEPSSSRILTFALAVLVGGLLTAIMRHVCKLTDNAALGLWLANLPLIIAALVGLMAAPYTINKASGSISDVIAAVRGKRD